MQHDDATARVRALDARPQLASVIALAAGSLLSVAFMAHHTSMREASAREAVRLLAELARSSAIVHGGLIALILAVLFGLLDLVRALGAASSPARAGLVAYCAGVAFLVLAATINGFVAPSLASDYAAQPDAALAALAPVLRACHRANQALAQAGVVACSAGIVAWSIALLSRGTLARAIGAFGLAVGVVCAASSIFGKLSLDVRGMTIVIVAQSIWNLGVAVWLARLRAQAPTPNTPAP